MNLAGIRWIVNGPFWQKHENWHMSSLWYVDSFNALSSPEPMIGYCAIIRTPWWHFDFLNDPHFSDSRRARTMMLVFKPTNWPTKWPT